MRLVMRHVIVCTVCNKELAQSADVDPNRSAPQITADEVWSGMVAHNAAIGHVQTRMETRFALVVDESPYLGFLLGGV